MLTINQPYRLPRVLSRLSALVVLTALVALPSRAQFEQPVARLLGHIGADETMAGDSRLLVGSSLIVDLDEWLPQTTPDSRMTLLRVMYGIQDDAVRTPFRLTVFDLMLQRGWWSSGLKVAEMDRLGVLPLEDTWAEIKTGPGFHAENESVSASGSVQLLGGWKRFISDPSTDADSQAGWRGGLRLAMAFHWKSLVKGVIEVEQIGMNEWRTASASLEIRPAHRIAVTAFAETVSPPDNNDTWVDGERAGVRLDIRLR